MAKLKENYLVEKRNMLNEIRANNMTLQELRFFAIYLSKINARDTSTRVVRFTMDDFRAIMGLGRIDIKYMKNVTNSLLCKVVNVPIVDEKGRNRGYTGFQIFKECTVSQDEHGEWYVEIDAHDKALPLMFDFKRDYFSYPLFNALRLRSANQIRMYELLRQYKQIGSKVYLIDELKKDLWLGENEYPRFGDFKIWVLDVCQQALREHTDIKFAYAPYGKRGKSGRILSLIFYIEENNEYTDQLTLDMFIDEQKAAIDVSEEGSAQNETEVCLPNVAQPFAEEEKNIPFENTPAQKSDKPASKESITIKTDAPPAQVSPEKPYGPNNVVMLTDTGYSSMERDMEALFPGHGKEKLNYYIEQLDYQITCKNKSYKNHASTMMHWARRDVRNQQDTQPVPAVRAAKRVNRFVNFKQRDWDYEEIERLERQHIINELNKGKQQQDI